MPEIAIINATPPALGITDQQVKACADALQTQLTRDFAPVWGIQAKVRFFTRREAQASGIPKAMWWLAILGDSDEARALGYHDVTPYGRPLGKVFAKTDAAFGASWTASASRELLAMLVDPDIDLAVHVQERALGDALVAYEICDPCQDDRFGYMVGGVRLADFLTPAWFAQTRRAGGADFDFQRKIDRPFQLLPGGQIAALRLSTGAGWRQISAGAQGRGKSAQRLGVRPAVGSRQERRTVPRSQWIFSDLGLEAGPGLGMSAGGSVRIAP